MDGTDNKMALTNADDFMDPMEAAVPPLRSTATRWLVPACMVHDA